MKKTYEYLYGTSANVSLPINGQVVSILFDGGRVSPRFVRPKYKTSNTAEQEAIEESPFFNILIYLTKEEEEDDLSQNIPVIPTPIVNSNTVPDSPILPPIESINPKLEEAGDIKVSEKDTDKPGDGEVLEHPAIKVQEAREFLITEYKVKPSQLPNKESILRIAAELKVSFPNLP